MSFWTLGEKRHYPNKPIICKYCGGEMIMRWSKIFGHCDYLHEVMRRKDAGQNVDEVTKLMDDIPSAYSYADDMEWKCKDCGCCQMFGVAITLEQYQKLRDARGVVATYIDIDEWKEDKKIAQQYKDLGYFGG